MKHQKKKKKNKLTFVMLINTLQTLDETVLETYKASLRTKERNSKIKNILGIPSRSQGGISSVMGWDLNDSGT